MINSKLEFKKHPLELYFQASIFSGNFLDPANLLPVEKREILNAGASYEFNDTTLTLEIKNIGDDRISDIMGFPLPGKSFAFTIHRKFK